VYPDSSCCRDKVNRAAGRRSVGSVFCFPFIKCTLTIKLPSYYRDYYVIRLYRDETTSVRLPRLAKNSPTLTQTATQLYHRAVRCYSCATSQAAPLIEFIMTRKLAPSTGIKSSANFILTRPACPLAHLHMIIHCFVFEEGTKPVHEHHLQVSQPCASLYPAFYQDLKLQHLTAMAPKYFLS